ncbi:MAG: SDR family oxidoreductase [Acidimicrobiales bacterium]|nr:SDR family oxidoreductase [Acidimicrobiales bacterium]RZV47224.1 MAG: SDR family oxidoreductase [Acidimicrobiales bacterium]
MTDRMLDGKVALITGAGREGGIGQATATRLAEAGAHVVITDLARDRPELRQNEAHGLGDDLASMQHFCAELEADYGVRSYATPLDVTSQEEAESVVTRVVDELGSLDILFNNAGATTGVGWFMDLTDPQWDLAWEVNAMGTRRMTMLAIPVMQRQGGGVIVNNASVGGLVADPGYGAYTASKFAVVAISKTVAKEHGKDGIRCVAVCPGIIDTGMAVANRQLVADLEGITVDEASRLMLDAVPLDRWGQADDVAQTVTFLCSPAASYINGIALPIDGGMLP